LIPIARCKDITLFADETGFFSFTNSPYYAHRHLSSVDVYPRRGVREICSPVEGIVIEARRLKIMEDYFIAVEAGESGTCAKILHAKPHVNVGDHVDPRNVIGSLVRSPFYSFWTDLHIHVEVRPVNDRLRARGGYNLDPTPTLSQLKLNCRTSESFRVVETSDRYTLLEPVGPTQSFTPPVTLSLQGIPFALEGGVTHYGHGAIWNRHGGLSKEILGQLKKLFQIDLEQNGYFHFNCPKRATIVRGCEYRGIGLNLNDPYVKLIPKRIGCETISVGDELSANEILPFADALGQL